MQTIGERLEEARKRKGLSIREAAEHTKIRSDYLQKFEANSFEIDLPPLYIRGFVRTYARYLEMDAERIVSEVEASLGRESKPARREHREPIARVDFGAEPRKPESSETGEKVGGRDNDKAMLIKFGLLGGGALLVIVLIILVINVLSSSKPAKPAPAAAETPAAQVAGPKENVLTVTAKGAVRVKVARVSDDSVLLDGRVTLNAGESRMVRYSEKIKITVDIPANLAIELNGRRVDVPIKEYGYFFIEP